LPSPTRPVLVEFEPGYVPGFALVNLEDELSALVGRRVDLQTPGSLSKYFRDRIVREAQDQYVRV
jgi:predicted nucleotidyltransferase